MTTHSKDFGPRDPPSVCSVPCMTPVLDKTVHWPERVDNKPKSPSIVYPTTTVELNNYIRVVSDKRSPHGTVQGMFTTVTPTSKCSIIGTILPMWAFVVESFGLIIHHIQLSSPVWVPFCLQLWPNANVTTTEYTHNPYVFCDQSAFPRPGNDIWKHAKVIMMYSFQDSEQKVVVPADWSITWKRASHAATGGCTNGFWSVAVLCRYDTPKFDLPLFPQRQLAGAWDSKHSGLAVNPITSRSQEAVGVHRLDALTISPWGLCPVNSASTTYVVGPGIFSPTKFVRRRLKPAELFLAWDLPLHVTELSSIKFLKRNISTVLASPV